VHGGILGFKCFVLFPNVVPYGVWLTKSYLGGEKLESLDAVSG
jgi:hypothetical protein